MDAKVSGGQRVAIRGVDAFYRMSSGWNFDTMHVPGVFNDVANGASRWDTSTVRADLVRARPHIPWQVRELVENGKYLCTSVLASNSSETPLHPRQSAPTKGISVRGWNVA